MYTERYSLVAQQSKRTFASVRSLYRSLGHCLRTKGLRVDVTVRKSRKAQKTEVAGSSKLKRDPHTIQYHHKEFVVLEYTQGIYKYLVKAFYGHSIYSPVLACTHFFSSSSRSFLTLMSSRFSSSL